MYAHNQHLLQVQPFKARDFNALFSLATDVWDAVLSFPDEHLKEFTYSTVIISLASKLPIQLQIDWGEFAYLLRPSFPSLKDMQMDRHRCWGRRISWNSSLHPRKQRKLTGIEHPRQQSNLVNLVAAAIVARRC